MNKTTLDNIDNEARAAYAEHGMHDGQRLREDCFPVLWPRPDSQGQ